MNSFIAELKRRHVVRVGIVYAAVAFVVLQVADLSFTRLGLPDWTVTLVLVLALLGFPISLVLAWAFDLTPGGVRRTEALQPAVPDDSGGPGDDRAPRAHAPASVLPWRGFAAMAVLLLLLAAAFSASLRPPSAEAPTRPPLRFEIVLPDSLGIEELLIVPDGTRMLMRGSGGWFSYSFADMSLAGLALPALDEALPFSTSISPDGATLEFNVNGLLRTIPIEGGVVRTLADSVRQAAWGDDGFLYMVRRLGQRTRIQRLPAQGGAIEELLVAGDSTAGYAVLPLPGSRRLLYWVSAPEGQAPQAFVLDRETRRSEPIASPALGSAVLWDYMSYLPTGHLLFTASDGVYAIAFDPQRRETTGAPIRLVSGGVLGYSAAAGMLAYSGVAPQGPGLVDRSGRRRELPGATTPGTWSFGVAASRTGDALVFWKYQSLADRWDIWTYALPNGPQIRVSADSFVMNRWPHWSEDGGIRFIARRNDQGILVGADATGGAIETLLVREGGIEDAASLPDGRMVLALEHGGLVLATLDGSAPDSSLVESRFSVRRPDVSIDGNWLAYASDEAGGREVFVRPLGRPAERLRVSRNGGDFPVWSTTGNELYFSGADSLHAARIETAPAPRVTNNRALFRLGAQYSGAFDVLPGDSLFAMIGTDPAERGRIVVVANLLDELRSSAPAH